MINLLTFVDEPQQGEGHAGKRERKREGTLVVCQKCRFYELCDT